ncbi:MAG: hypothetical protein K0S28_1555 [Paucimonas sp.]|jgi:hypothetical protein|nr:hypothetical protein [Paucimonas sp.]
MKNAVLGMAIVAGIVGCTTPAQQTETTAMSSGGSVQSADMTPPSGSGTWRFSDQWWTDGRKFCQYNQGRDRFIGTMEMGEKCPVEVKSQ